MSRMKVLVLGGGGMLGHKATQRLSQHFEVFCTVRSDDDFLVRLGIVDHDHLLTQVNARNIASVESAIEATQPDVVLNCVGVVKQLESAKDPETCIAINSLFPHQVARIVQSVGGRFVHISTDCVFDGNQGQYTEDDQLSASDLYGRTKFLGEVHTSGSLTLRTSIIGRELNGSHGLVEWFLGQEGQSIRGFKRAIFSGVTTNTLADIVGEIILNHNDLSGLYHLSADPINKYDLLAKLKEHFKFNVQINEDEEVVIDRSLNSDRLRNVLGDYVPSWDVMIQRLVEDRSPYASWRQQILGECTRS